MTAREYYRSYQADDSLSPLSDKLIEEIMSYNPANALDFGCGSGKHMNVLRSLGVTTAGVDISMMNIVRAYGKYELPCLLYGNEEYLRNLRNFDVVFTCSVLDHIQDITHIIEDFKRIAWKSVILAETNDSPAEHYYPHVYENYGFEKGKFSWTGEDGAVYHIWRWNKPCAE